MSRPSKNATKGMQTTDDTLWQRHLSSRNIFSQFLTAARYYFSRREVFAIMTLLLNWSLASHDENKQATTR